MDLNVMYKLSVISSISENIRKVPFEHAQFSLQLTGGVRETFASGQLDKYIMRLIFAPFP
jgi:hypothetical protein